MGHTVRVSNVSQKATERDIYDFFAFSGEISSIQTKPCGDEAPGTLEAFVTFQEERSLETALLLTGAVIADKPVNVELAEGYVPPATSAVGAYAADTTTPAQVSSADTLKKTEGIVAGLLASGYILGKDAMEKAKVLDEKHELSAKAKLHAETLSKGAADIDSKYLISKRLAETSATVSRSLSTMDEKYQVSTKTKEALTAAESSLTEASNYMMKNKYVSSSTSWLAGALGQLKVIVDDVQKQTAEKVHKAEEDRIMGRRTPQEDEEEAERRAISSRSSENVGLGDHGPPVGSDSTPSLPSLMDAPLSTPHTQPAPAPTPAPAPKSAMSSADPPIF